MQGGEIMLKEADDVVDLPPGFRFHPTDEEIISHYLARKAMEPSFTALAIAEVDMNKCEPWDLPKKFNGGEKENYFFCQRDRKYPTGMRTNRATQSGYWKATGKDKEIYRTKSCLVGMKKTLVFYKGRAPKGEKTNWVMHEYRLEGRYCYYSFPKGAKDEWVVCRVFHKSVGMGRSPTGDLSRVDSFLNHFLDDDPCLPPLVDIPSCSTRGPGSQEFKGPSQHANYFPANIPKLENVFFMPTSYDIDNYNYASSSNPIPNQSYPFSGFKATPPSISAAIPGTHDSESQYCQVEPFFSNANSMVSPSRDTGISNDISSIETNKSQDDLHSISVDPSMSGLDPLWECY